MPRRANARSGLCAPGHGIAAPDRPNFAAMSLRHLPALAGLLLAVAPLRAQERSVSTQSLYWVRYAGTVVVNDDWSVFGEVETRRYWRGSHQHQYLLPRVTAYYTGVEGLKFGLGGTYFLQALPHDPDAEIEDFQPEWRPHADLIQAMRTGKVRWTNRLRVEGRFFGREADAGGRDWTYNTRFRVQSQVAVPVTGKEATVGVQLKAFDEVMFNAGSNVGVNVFDQNRIGGGADLRFSPALAVSVEHFWWWQQRASGTDFWSRQITRLTFKHRIAVGHKAGRQG